MQSEVCNEKNDKTDRISFIVHKTSNFCPAKSNYDVSTVSKKILLSQVPEETINLNFTFEHNYYQNSKSSGYSFRCYFDLIFENNLHDVSNDYGYETNFYLHVHNCDASSHTLLYSHKKIRNTKNILVSERKQYSEKNQDYPEVLEKLIMKSDGRHICCNIRRYNKKNVQDVNLRSIQSINVGAILFDKGLYSDTLLSVGKENFHVHKDILSSVSDVFKAMFSHDMLENEKGKIIIEDFGPEIVEGLLSFIYTGKTSLLSKMPLELFQIAHKYGIYSLQEQCKEFFLFGINNKNIVSMLDTANTYDLTDLKANLMNYVYNHDKNLVDDKSFQQFLLRDLSKDNVVYILELCDKYKYLPKDLKTKAFEVAKKNNETLANNADFLKLFELHPSLMKELYVFTNKKD